MPSRHEDIEALYRTHGGALLGYLRRAFGDGADDLLQETFFQAMRGRDRLDAAQSARAWLFGIARRVGLAAIRRNKPCQALPEVPAADAQTDERLAAVRAAIASLPEAQRETLELRLRNELSYEEIAAVLGIPVGTVRSRLHGAVKTLRDRLAGDRLERG
jgi:RNA polymerase sigma-70 factor (ECF subfamily)